MAWDIGAPFHLGIVTTDMDGVMGTLGAVLGLTWVALDRPDVTHYTPNGRVRPSPRVSYSPRGPLHVEVLEAAAGTVYDENAGTHLHHVGYWTDDFTGDVSTAQIQGWSVEAAMTDGTGRLTTFAYLTRPGDLRIELIDAAQRPALLALFETSLACGGLGNALPGGGSDPRGGA